VSGFSGGLRSHRSKRVSEVGKEKKKKDRGTICKGFEAKNSLPMGEKKVLRGNGSKQFPGTWWRGTKSRKKERGEFQKHREKMGRD